MKLVAKPPSIALKKFSSDVVVTESFIKNTAQKELLPCHEVQMWLEHLKVIIENWKRGADKAAATRCAKKAAQFIPLPATQSTPTQSLPSVATQCVPSSTGPSSATEWFCGTCGRDYEETGETETWIAWYVWYVVSLCVWETKGPTNHWVLHLSEMSKLVLYLFYILCEENILSNPYTYNIGVLVGHWLGAVPHGW